MDNARLIHERSAEGNVHSMTGHEDFDDSCPFCVIAATYPPIDPLNAPGAPALDPWKVDPPSFVLFSSQHVIAFLDIMPLTRGHVLISPRKHRVKAGNLSPDESAEIGRVLPMLARSVMKAVLPDIPHEQVDYNIVQNNGPGAAQVVNHVHFHVIPRPPFNYQPPASGSKPRGYPANKMPEGYTRQAILLGRGQRSDLYEEEAQALVEEIRLCVKNEIESASPKAENLPTTEGSQTGTSGHGRSNNHGKWKV